MNNEIIFKIGTRRTKQSGADWFKLLSRLGSFLCDGSILYGRATKLLVHFCKRFLIQVVDQTKSDKLHDCGNKEKDRNQGAEINRKVPGKLGDVDVRSTGIGINCVVDKPIPCMISNASAGPTPCASLRKKECSE